jgi:Membrane proteins related to metalloendopeptidases
LRDRGSIRWSLIVMRGPDKRVRQFRMRRRFVVAAPAALLLLFAACLALLQARASWQLAALKRELTEQTALHQAALAAKDGQISALEAEVRALSDNQGELEARLRDLHELERRLENFFDRYGENADAPEGLIGLSGTDAAGKSDTDGWDPTVGPDAPAPPEATAADMIRLLHADEPDFRAISGMVDDLDRSMALRLEEARRRKQEADALPSAWPTRSRRVTSTFGYRRDPYTGETAFHAGIDIAGRKGDPVYAAGDGEVADTGSNTSRGRYIVIAHRNRLRSLYYHLSDVEVEPGDSVKRGERIGALGSSGRSTGPHLHFAVESDGESVNPFEYLELVKED